MTRNGKELIIIVSRNAKSNGAKMQEGKSKELKTRGSWANKGRKLMKKNKLRA